MRTDLQADAFQELVDQRSSCRRYRPDPVPEDALMKMVDAARAAPSACNRQPWRFVIVAWPRSIQPVSLITVGYAAETGMELNRSSRLDAADTVKWL